MIEIIREENWDDTKEKKLPKDIRQIGRPDVGERIYIEDEVYRYLHPYESSCEKLVYVLLGRFENYSGRQCTFVEAAIQLEHLEFDAKSVGKCLTNCLPPLPNSRPMVYILFDIGIPHFLLQQNILHITKYLCNTCKTPRFHMMISVSFV